MGVTKLRFRFLSLLGGTASGQAIMLSALLFTTSLYSPHEFGMLAAFAAVVQLILPAICLRYDLAIPVPKSKYQARALLFIGLTACVVISVIYLVALIVMADCLSADLNRTIGQFGWLIPITLIFAGAFSCSQYWAVRVGAFKNLAVAHVMRGVSGAGVQVAFAYYVAGPFGLVLGQSVYMGLGSIALLVAFFRSEWKGISRLRTRYLGEVARRNWRFPLYSSPEAMLDSAGAHVPILLIISLAGAETGGVVYLAQRLTTIPIGLIGGSLSRVYLGEARHRFEVGELFVFTRKLMGVLSISAVLPFAAIYYGAPSLLLTFASVEWQEVGRVLTYLIPASYLQFCVMPVSTVFAIRSKQHVSLVVQALGLVLQVGAVLLFHLTGFANEVVGLGVGAFFYYLIYVVAAYRVAKV